MSCGIFFHHDIFLVVIIIKPRLRSLIYIFQRFLGLRINQLNTAMVLINLAKQLDLLYEFLRLVSAKCSPTNSFWGSRVEISLLEGASLGV